ncbi:MAG TPA: family 78 glycoside hydrolase catalytic domain [Acidimicrobiia bacterium]|nr:family 78 glycoside hydrolase catalytic domain [Acidimicrobiia bacterium]
MLTVAGLASPVGLDPTDVVFAWRVRDARRGTVQSGYRIVVSRVRAGAHETAPMIWDSGRVWSAANAFVPYRGPALAPDAVYRWQVQTWDGSGRVSAFSAPGSFETGLRDEDWRADWIQRPASVTTEPDQYTYARREAVLDGSPIVRARAYVSGDQQYELYVNGTRAGKGQAYSYPDTQYYETLDVTRLLRAGGANAFGLVYAWDGPTKGHPAGTPGVIAQISVLHRDGRVETVATDGSWRVRRGAWLPGTQRDLEGDLVHHTEHIDGPAQPIGWDRPGFDDHSWAPATVLGRAGVAPWTHLVSVRTRIVEEPVRAVSLTRLASGAVVADFGKVYAAVPTVRFHHGTAGRVIEMRAGYLLDEPAAGESLPGVVGQVSVDHGTQHTDMSYTYVQRGGVEQFHPFDYLGFRYFQIDDPGEPLSAADVVALTRHTAVADEHAATFSSPNPTVNAIFELGRHSALFSAQEQFLDTPTREKGPWLWDGYNESVTAMAAFGEQNLTRKSLVEFAQSQARYWPNGAVNKIYPTGLGALDINEFTEIYPEWVWQYWMHTGDRALLAQVYPVLTNLSDYVHASIDPSTGLVTKLPATNIYYDFPTVTRINVLGVNVFRRVGDIGAALGRPAPEIAYQRARRSELMDAINSRLTRPDGTYADGLEADQNQTPRASQDTNACALVYGVVPPAHQAVVGAFVAALGMSAPPRTASEVLDALSLTRHDRDLVRILTDATIDGWANVLARGGTFTWEVWEPSDLIGDSMSHGWGANVLVSIQRALLGVTPTAPGYQAFAVEPPSAGLASASGTVPTPQGTITVGWQRPTATETAFTIDVTVPPNAGATVSLPAKSPDDITENGEALAHATDLHLVHIDRGNAVIHLGSGTYHLRASARS